MGRSRELEGFRSICFISELGQEQLKLSWKRLLQLRGQRGLAAALTLIGAGTMGAVLAFKFAPNPSGILSFPWSGGQSASSGAKGISPKIEELTVPGLRNMGNNCFLNVILQALASSEVLVAFVKADSHFNGAPESQQSFYMPLAEAVSGLLTELSQLGTGRRVANPREVMGALGYYVKKFDLANQQDSAEALGHLVCALQEERAKYFEVQMPNVHSLGNALRVLGGAIAEPASRDELKLEHFLESWRQNLRWPMQGTLSSLLICQQCSFQFSTDVQFFNEISLAPLQDAGGNILRGCTLEDCLKQFTTPECIVNVKCNRCSHLVAADMLRDMNFMPKLIWRAAWKGVDEKQIELIRECSCDDDCACEALTIGYGGAWNPVYTAASKRLLIGRAPEVLCLQIQRAGISQTGDLKKLNGHVIFPKTLDIYPYTIAAPDIFRSSGKHDIESLMQMMEEIVLPRMRFSDHPELSLNSGMLCKSGVALGKLDSRGMNETLERVENSLDVDFNTCGSTNGSSVCSHVCLNSLPQHILCSDPMLEQARPCSDQPGVSNEDTCFENISEHMLSDNSRNLHGPLALASTDVNSAALTSLTLAGQKEPSGNVPDLRHSSKNLTGHSKNILYKLFSVVVHHGGPHSGHYTVYRRARIPVHDYNQGVAANGTPDQLHVYPREGESVDAIPWRCSDSTITGAINAEGYMSSSEPDATVSPNIFGRGLETQIIWFKVSDSDVRRVSEDEVYMADASQLFYERLNE